MLGGGGGGHSAAVQADHRISHQLTYRRTCHPENTGNVVPERLCKSSACVTCSMF